MSLQVDVAVRFATWWVDIYTRTAPHDVAVDRRAELESDLYEQTHGGSGPDTKVPSGWAVAKRVLIGVPADIGWRLEVECVPGRLRWHLAHPTTVLAAGFAVALPLTLVSDAGRGRVQAFARVEAPVDLVAHALAVGLVTFALVAVAFALSRIRSWERPSWRQFRSTQVFVMTVTWALAVHWRFWPPPLETVANLAWVVFGATALLWLASMAGSQAHRFLRLDFGKVPS